MPFGRRRRSFGRDRGFYPPPSVPRPVKDGLRAKSKRGAIGGTWWSRRFIEVLEDFHEGPRLVRGRAYARRGQVIDMDRLQRRIGRKDRQGRQHGKQARETIDELVVRAEHQARAGEAERFERAPHDIERAVIGRRDGGTADQRLGERETFADAIELPAGPQVEPRREQEQQAEGEEGDIQGMPA